VGGVCARACVCVCVSVCVCVTCLSGLEGWEARSSVWMNLIHEQKNSLGKMAERGNRRKTALAVTLEVEGESSTERSCRMPIKKSGRRRRTK